jgi:hypothetical protein
VGTVLSLMLCAAAGWLWWRSFSVEDRVIGSRMTVEKIAVGYSQFNHRNLTIGSADGRIGVQWDRFWMPVHDATVMELQNTTDRYRPHGWDEWEHQTWPMRGNLGPLFGSRFGFSWYREVQLRPKDPLKWRVVFPHWLAVVIFALPPVLVARKIFRRRRKAGMCPVCGYDMRATPERCPECGTQEAATS